MNRALPEGASDPMDFTGKATSHSKADSTAPPKDVPQASTQTELYENCLKRSSGLCVLALLDASSASHAEHTQVANAAAGRWERQPLQFSWIDAARQVHSSSLHHLVHLMDPAEVLPSMSWTKIGCKALSIPCTGTHGACERLKAYNASLHLQVYTV